MRTFVRSGLAPRIVFGSGTLSQVREEAAALGAGKVLVLSTPRQAGLADRVERQLGEMYAGTFAQAEEHTPVEVTDRALGLLHDLGADCVVSIGGGSTTGLGKAIALRTGVPQVAVPTTYAGSEVTAVLGETTSGQKTTMSSPEVLPETVIYDVDLTLTLPWDVTLTSAVNAMAHCVEALYSPNAGPSVGPSVTGQAVESIRVIARNLPELKRDLHDLDARTEVLYGAWLAGACLARVEMALHHKLCHTLGGSFSLPHSPTHAVVLPYAMAYNAPAAGVAMEQIAIAMGVPDAPSGMQDLIRSLGGPTSLGQLGLGVDDIERAVELATTKAYPNPREVTAEGLRDLLTRAQKGQQLPRC
ncbi:MAG TPA: maleylacetate reductase [Nocardioidaceae bacterium]|nr:maleylacetate reductase [Nocardioidaceae bacterium]